MAVALALFFALGAVTASFMGVVAARLFTNERIVQGRSRCDACALELSPRALIPILSFVYLKGRASCCGTRLSYGPPVAEAVLGTVFALTYAKLGITLLLPFTLLAFAFLLALVLYDFAHQVLPPVLLAPFVAIAAIVAVLDAPSLFAFWTTALVAVAIGGSLALLHYASNGRAMGLADAPLAFGLALLVGAQALSGFVFSFWIGAVCGIALLLRRPPGSRMGIEVPFAPYLALGFLLAYFTQWNPFAIALSLAAF